MYEEKEKMMPVDNLLFYLFQRISTIMVIVPFIPHASGAD